MVSRCVAGDVGEGGRREKRNTLLTKLPMDTNNDSFNIKSITVQQNATIFSFIIFLQTALHVSDDTFIYHQEHSKNCNYNIWRWSSRVCYRPLTWRIRNKSPLVGHCRTLLDIDSRCTDPWT